MLGTTAIVHAAEPAAADGGMASLVPLILIMVIFYFLLIRPQQKRVKEHKSMVEALKKGDKVITGGGIIGTVADAKDDILKVDIAEGVRIRVKRDTVSGHVEIEKQDEKKKD
ncbi:MAG: preprotein translocase subunit YajC [Mariprofundaceae bacterium]